MVDLIGIATLILVGFTGYYARDVHKQSSIMYKNAHRELRLKEYDVKTMTNLVGLFMLKRLMKPFLILDLNQAAIYHGNRLGRIFCLLGQYKNKYVFGSLHT
jgi:hypothetical protein